jgi:lipoprotein-releasing system permease protein
VGRRAAGWVAVDVSRAGCYEPLVGYPIDVALRYLGSRKRAFISVGTAFAILGVALGVAALATVMSVTGGFQAQFRESVLGVNAHVLVLKYSTDFREYRTIMDQVSKVPGVVGTAPFSINPMMLTHGDATATGVLLKGVDPEKSLGVGAPPGTKPVLILPQQIVGCEEVKLKEGLAAAIKCGQSKLTELRLPNAKPAERRVGDMRTPTFDDIAPRDLAPRDAEPRDAGVNWEEPEIDDAGRNVTLLRAIQADIDRREQEKDAGRRDDVVTGREAPTPAATADQGPTDAGPAPYGEIVPDGGYASVLPPDDAVLPPDVDPDPCASPARVRELPGIVVGSSLAKTLNLVIGDCVTVTSPTIGYSFSGGSLKAPVARRYRVTALFTAGFDQYDSKLVYTDLYEAQMFYDQGDTVTGVEMIVDDIDKAPAISREIGDMLGSGLYHTMDWEELNHGLFTALRIQQIGMSVVLALIILVAAFTVVATLVMVVLDKTKEIAVMKAMGATDGAVLRIFLYQGGIIGLAGTVLGLLLGLLLCKGLLVYGFPLDPKVYFISRLPVLVRPQEFLLTGEAALAICLCATIVPSLYAAEMSPADGFRERSGGGSGHRRRHWLLSLWIYRVYYANTTTALLCTMFVQSGSLPTRWLGAAAVLGASSICALALLLWRRWGLWGLTAMAVVKVAALAKWGIPFATLAYGKTGLIVCLVLIGLEVLSLLITYLGIWRHRRSLE